MSFQNKPTESEGVRLSMSLSEGETKFVQDRMVRVEKCLKDLGIKCESKHVPRIALLASGGGERAMIGLLGCLEQMYNAKLLDSVLYLCGVSGSTWCMASMYEEPAWSSKFPSLKGELVKRLTEEDIDRKELIKWLSQAIEDEHYSLTDFWAATVVYGYVKKINTTCLSDLKSLEATDPYPIYTANNQVIKNKGDEVVLAVAANPVLGDLPLGCWFELSPHEVGYSCLGAFVDTSTSRSQFEAGVLKQKSAEKDMLYLQGVCGSALADGKKIFSQLKNSILKWLKSIFNFGKENNASASEVEIHPDLAQAGDMFNSAEEQKEKPPAKKRKMEMAEEIEIKKEEGVSLHDILTEILDSILKLLDCKDDEEITKLVQKICEAMAGYGNEDGIDEDGESRGKLEPIPACTGREAGTRRVQVANPSQVPLDDIATKTFESILNLFDEEITMAMTDENPENGQKPEENLVGNREEAYLVDDFGGHPFRKFGNNLSHFADVIKIIRKTMTVLATWTWGTKYNLLYKINLPEAEVPEEVLSDEHSYLEDAGLVLNSPYVAALRPDRNVDLLLSFDFSAGDPFLTVTQAAEHCQSTGIPFPPVEIPEEDRKKPKDCYVFKGDNTPTVIHIPLFNMVNTEGNVEKWSETYPTFHRAYDRKTMDELIRVSGLNVTNNKEKIIQEIADLCK